MKTNKQTEKIIVEPMVLIDEQYRQMYSQEHESILDSIYEKEKSINTMTKEIKPLKKFIQDYIGDFAGLITGKYFVTFKKEESTQFDTASFKAEYPDLYEHFTKKQSRRKWILNPK